MNTLRFNAVMYRRLLTVSFFVTYFLVGIFVFDDYGISWDEHTQRDYGFETFEHVFEGDTALFTDRSRYYGPVFMFVLAVIEKMFSVTSARTAFLLRHNLTFLLFYVGVIFFCLLCRHHFRSWKAGLLGGLFLILSPRIFADSFYNPKDIPCLSFFIVSFYTMVRFIEKKTIVRAVVHAFVSALLIDVRIVGILVPLLTVLFAVLDLVFIKATQKEFRNTAFILGIYGVVVLCVVILFWPTLWRNPVYYFMEAFKSMSHFQKPMRMRYLGAIIETKDLPWHYTLVWIAITTPIMYTVSFCIGVIAVVVGFLRNPVAFYLKKKETLMFLAWFSLPLLAVVIGKSVLYDGWRQMFFIYPGFLLIALIGIRSVLEYSSAFVRLPIRKGLSVSFSFLIGLNLFFVFSFMIRYHPLQNVYFNSLAGDPKEVHPIQFYPAIGRRDSLCRRSVHGDDE